MLGLIKRICREFRDVSTLRTLYCTLVRSQLEYGSVVWSPFTARNITKLERVQRHTTKQRCIQVFKFGGPLDPFLKNLGVQLINIQELIFDLLPLIAA